MPELEAALAAVARLAGADVADCAPTSNTTAGLTTVLNALPLSEGTALLTLSTAYSSITTAVGRAAAAARRISALLRGSRG